MVLTVLVISRQKGEEKEFQQQEAAKEVPFFPDFNPEAVTHITVEKISDSLDFKKEGGYWMVANAGQSPILQDSIDESQEPKAGEEAPETPAETTEEGGFKKVAEGPVEGAEGTPNEEQPEKPPKPEKVLKYYRADETLVADGILNAIKDLKREELVSSDPENKTQFQVLNSIVGIDVTAEDAEGNVLAHFIIGKAADMMSTSNYVRKADEDDIYEVRQALQNMFGRPFNAWRDKTMFYFDATGITEFKLTGTTDGDLTFNKDADGVWQGEEGITWPVDTAKVGEAVEQMSLLKATDFAGAYVKPEDTGLENPTKRVIATGLEGSYQLIIGTLTDDGKYYCSVNDDNTVWMVLESDIKQVFLDRDSLEQKPVPETPPAVESNPEITD